jgi:hypothetical protein
LHSTSTGKPDGVTMKLSIGPACVFSSVQMGTGPKNIRSISAIGKHSGCAWTSAWISASLARSSPRCPSGVRATRSQRPRLEGAECYVVSSSETPTGCTCAPVTDAKILGPSGNSSIWRISRRPSEACRTLVARPHIAVVRLTLCDSSGEVVARHDPRPEPHSDRERC